MKQYILGKVMAFFIEMFLTKLYPVARDTGFCWPLWRKGFSSKTMFGICKQYVKLCLGSSYSKLWFLELIV